MCTTTAHGSAVGELARHRVAVAFQHASSIVVTVRILRTRSGEQKSDSGPAEWMPAARSFWCSYDQRFVTILTHYRLRVTAADKTAIARVLADC